MNPAGRLLALYDRVAEAPEAVPCLRRFVLDLAVRGKLVEQDPADEPASELLKRIAAEKARLVKTGAMRKKVANAPDIVETPFLIARTWVWTRITDIGVLSPRNRIDDDRTASFVPMPLIPAEWGKTNAYKRRPWGEIKKGYTHFAEGDVGLAKITPCFENRKSVVFRNLAGGIGSGTTELHIVRPVLMNANYILLFLKSSLFIENGISRMTGTAGQKRVPKEYFANSPFPLPPLAEQHRIVAKVDELMALCDRLEASREKREENRDRLTKASLCRLGRPDTDLPTFRSHARFAIKTLLTLTSRADQIKQLRQSILDLAVRGKLAEQDPADEPASELLKRIAAEKARLVKLRAIRRQKTFSPVTNSPFSVPQNWCWARMRQVTSDREQRVPESAFTYIDVSTINKEVGSIVKPIVLDPSEAPSRARKVAKKGDVIYSCVRPYLLNIAIIEDCFNPEPIVSTAFAVLNGHGLVLSRYLWITLRSPFMVSCVEMRQRGQAYPAIKDADFSSLPFPLPPLAEQHRIIAKVDELMALCDRIEADLEVTSKSRQRCLDLLVQNVL